jgi:hypothetical protein
LGEAKGQAIVHAGVLCHRRGHTKHHLDSEKALVLAALPVYLFWLTLLLFRSEIQSEEVELVHGSILEVDWSDGDVVLANSTCFEEDLMKALAHKAAELKPGTFSHRSEGDWGGRGP